MNLTTNKQLQHINERLAAILPSDKMTPKRLHHAMRYVVLNGGKRLRPLLVYATGAALDIPIANLDATACAVELIHAYSLVHDDLPAMDDDQLRRGKPTCHIAYDEATAILVGDALQALAFNTLANDTHLPAENKIKMMQVLTKAAGSTGMVGGQALDLAAEGQALTLSQLETIHQMKTGALITASIELAALANDEIDQSHYLQLIEFGRYIGLAFQIQDDILDIESDTTTLGKQQGADLALNKATYPALIGMQQAKQKIKELKSKAMDCLKLFGDKAHKLQNLANYITNRIS